MNFSLKFKQHRKKILLSILFISVFLSITYYKIQQPLKNSADLSIPTDLYGIETPGIGIRADSRILDQFPVISPPPLSKTGKTFLTLNKMGFDVLSVSLTWVAEEFLNFCKENPGEFVLDVGTGYSPLSRQALTKGVYVISNDLDIRHLLYSRKKVVNSDECDKLFLNKNPFPHLDIPKNSLTAVILHRVLHFMSGEEIDIGLDKVKQWLKPKGKIFIAVMSSEHIAYREKYLPIFEKRKKEGDIWPGMYLDVPVHLPAQAYALPDKLHVMDQDILKQALERHGFQIERIGYVSMQGYGVEKGRDGKETIGAIAIKIE